MTKSKFRKRTDHSKGGKPHKCNVCNKSYSEKLALVEHIRTHTGEKPYHCHVCGKRFAYRSAFSYHLKIHSFRDPIICGKCGKYFSSKGALKVHTMLHTGEKTFICDTCGNAYSRKYGLDIHKKTHLNNASCRKRTGSLKKKNKSVKIFKCAHCSKVLCSKYSLRVHNRTHTGEKPFMCERCGKSFAHKNSLNDHIMRHTQDKLNKGECHIMEQHTVSKTCENNVEMTKENSARNTEIRPEAITLQSHKKSARVKRKPHKCDKCGRSFSKKCALVLHVRSHTEPYKCEECGESFKCKSGLEEHQCNQTGQKLHRCENCGKGFSSIDSLDVHTKTHSRQAPYTCEQCGSRFTHKASLQAHIMIHGGRKNGSGVRSKPFKDRIYLIPHIKKPGTMRETQSGSNALSQVSAKSSNGIFFRKQSVEKPFWCMECGKSFPLQFYLSRHLQTHKSSQSKKVKAHVSRRVQEKQDNAETFNQARNVNGLLFEGFTADSEKQDVLEQMIVKDSTDDSTSERSTNSSMQNYERHLKDFLSTFPSEDRKQNKCYSEYNESPCPITPTHVNIDLSFSKEKYISDPSVSNIEQDGSVAPDSSVNIGFQQPSPEHFDSSADIRLGEDPEYFTQSREPILDTVAVKHDMDTIEDKGGTIYGDRCSGDYVYNGKSGEKNTGSPSTNSGGNENSEDENVDAFSFNNYRTDSGRAQIGEIFDTPVNDKYWKDSVPCRFVKWGKLRSKACDTRDQTSSPGDLTDTLDSFKYQHRDKTHTDKSTQTENAPTDSKVFIPETCRISLEESEPLPIHQPTDDANAAPVENAIEMLGETSDTGTDNRYINDVASYVKSREESDVTPTGNPHKYKDCDKNIDCNTRIEEQQRQDKKARAAICAECDKSFSSKYNLRVHTRTHTGEKPFVCEKCGSRYAHKVSLQAHLVKHAESRGRLRMFKKTHNGVKPFSCEICSKSFVQRRSILNHKRMHAGEKPFSCKLCGKAYLYRHSLKIHSKTHLRKGISQDRSTN